MRKTVIASALLAASVALPQLARAADAAPAAPTKLSGRPRMRASERAIVPAIVAFVTEVTRGGCDRPVAAWRALPTNLPPSDLRETP